VVRGNTAGRWIRLSRAIDIQDCQCTCVKSYCKQIANRQRETGGAEGDRGCRRSATSPPSTFHTDATQTWVLAMPYRSRSKNLNIDSRSTDASEREDPGAIAEEAESAIPKEARLVRVPAHLQRPKAWRKADPAERRRAVTTRKLSRAIHPHLRHRSHPAMARNSTVRGRCSSDCPTSHHSFDKRSHFCHSWSQPRDPSSR
jgi:hypothetical protein